MNICVYHRVPQQPIYGSQLLPLSTLREKAPEIYDVQRRKYESRQELELVTIPYLDCLWGDVIFMTSIHPRVLVDTFAAYGFNLSGDYFQVPVRSLDLSALCLLQPQMKLPTPQDFSPFRVSDLEREVSCQMRRYLKENQESNEDPFLFAYSQHVLYRGNITISSLEIISISS